MQQDDQRNSTNLFDIIWLKSAVTGWWESSLYKQNLPGVSMGISWHDIVKSDPLEFVRSSIFSVFDKKSIQFLFITVQHYSQVINQKSKSVLWNLTRNVHMKMSLSNHNFVATSSQVQLIVTPQNS